MSCPICRSWYCVCDLDDATASLETLTKQRDMLLEACKKSSAHVRPTCDELYQELQTIIKQVESE